MIDCPYCDGSGNDRRFPSLDCDNCNGVGEVNPYANFYDGEEGLEHFYEAGDGDNQNTAS